jgi:hypothetical protein
MILEKLSKNYLENEMKPINKALNYIKISLISMFYGLDKSYVVYELNNNEELRKNFLELHFFEIFLYFNIVFYDI